MMIVQAVVQGWFAISVILLIIMYGFRLTNRRIPFLDEISIKGGPEERLPLTMTVNNHVFNITIAHLSNETDTDDSKYQSYLVKKAAEFCTDNAIKLELKSNVTEAADGKAAGETNKTDTEEIEDLKKSPFYVNCVTTIAEYLLQEATKDFFKRNMPPSKLAVEYLKFNQVNMTELLNKPLMIDMNIPYGTEDGQTLHTVRFDAVKVTPYEIADQFCENRQALKNDPYCIVNIDAFVVGTLENVDADSFTTLAATVDANSSSSSKGGTQTGAAIETPTDLSATTADIPVDGGATTSENVKV